MKNKKFLLGMLVMVLAFGMLVVGCEKDPPPQEEGEKTDLIISGTGGDGVFLLQLSSIDSVSWKSGVTGTDVLSWLDISIPQGWADLGYGAFTGLQVEVATTDQPIIIRITISYTSQVNPGGAYASSCQAIVTIKDDTATLSAIKAKTDGVEVLELKTQNKSATKLLLKRL